MPARIPGDSCFPLRQTLVFSCLRKQPVVRERRGLLSTLGCPQDIASKCKANKLQTSCKLLIYVITYLFSIGLTTLSKVVCAVCWSLLQNKLWWDNRQVVIMYGTLSHLLQSKNKRNYLFFLRIKRLCRAVKLCRSLVRMTAVLRVWYLFYIRKLILSNLHFGSYFVFLLRQ